MYIRKIAKELYSIYKKIEIMEKELKKADSVEKAVLLEKIKKLKLEKKKIKAILEGMKKYPNIKIPR